VCDLEIKSWGRANGHVAAKRMATKRLTEKVEKHKRTEKHAIYSEIKSYINLL